MMNTPVIAALFTVLHVVIQVALIARVLLRPHRDPESRVAWIVVIISLPILGMITYIALGEVNIGRRRIERMHEVLSNMPSVTDAPGADAPNLQADIPEHYAHLFRVGHSVSGYEPIGGNRAQLMADSNTAIDRIVADIDAAQDHVHLLFFIWLDDTNGGKIAEALKRAAARKVTCRAMVDAMGSYGIIGSENWKSMEATGVHLATALPVGNPLLRALKGRIDLRNHRKIIVIDNYITYCGSQNCADPEFRIKAKFAPWVDALMRFEGPIARQNQHLFASDWMSQVDDNIHDLLRQPIPPTEPGVPAQVIGTGPTYRYSAMPEVFESLMYTAHHEMVISTPYYVPDEPMQAALCAAARRGVDTTIIFPAVNDSWIVGGASRSYYADLLEAGVKIFEYEGGLLHTKSLTMDGDITLIGSANMDRRSFELNYENNILFYDQELTAMVYERQQAYIASSHPVTAEQVAAWPMRRRLLNNTLAILGPVL